MQYSAENFKGMQYCPFDLGGKKMWEKYPDLLRRRELCMPPADGVDEEEVTGDELNQLVRFMVLMVDPFKNPLAVERDFGYKAKICFDLLQIRQHENIRKWYERRHPWTMSVQTALFKLVNNQKFEAWFSLKESISANNEFLRMPLDLAGDLEKNMTARQKIQQGIDSGLAQLAKLEKQLFPSERLLDDIARDAVSDENWAERYAKAFKSFDNF